MTNLVQFYSSTDLNAPVLSGTVGSFITLLNKCLVDGYTTAGVTSLTRVGSVVTAVFTVLNTTFVVGNYVKISGANETDYNGTFQITGITGTGFTYSIVATPSSPATGTILYAKGGLGWTRPFAAGTNSQTYRSADVTSNQFYLQVIDNGATAGAGKEAQAYGAEVMTADQAVSVGRFPTAAQMASGVCWNKSATADATVRSWYLIGDDRTFYYFNTSNPSVAGQGSIANSRVLGFGHLLSVKPGDAYNTFILGMSMFPGAGQYTNEYNNFGYAVPYGTTGIIGGGLYIARSYVQTGSAVQLNTMGNGTAAGAPGSPSNGLGVYPNGPDTGAYFIPLTAWEGPHLRGRFPGCYAPTFAAYNNFIVNDRVTLNNPSSINLVAQYTSFAYSSWQSLCYGVLFFDLFGPWV